MNTKKALQELRVFALMILVVCSMRSALADWNDVPTGSMKPTIQEGDRVVVNKLAYDLKIPFTTIEIAKWGDPQRGDIVVLYSPVDGMRLVKRVVALPGDRIEMRDNQLLVNGRAAVCTPIAAEGDALIERETLYGKSHEVMFLPDMRAMRTFGPELVPAGHYFVMGDNRDNSNDSRYIQPIERQRIVGKAFAVAFSLDRSKYFAPRADRFFRPLK